MSSITSWAAHVQQSTTPRIRKHRRPSISRLHLNLAPSLPSIHAHHALPKHARARSGSASFLHILDTPSTGSGGGGGSGVSPNGNHGTNGMNNTPPTPKSSPHTADHTADPNNNAFDLTALGYTSLFLPLPTPATPHYPTPTPNLPSNPTSNTHDNAETKTFKAAFARLRSRSFSALRRPRKPSSNPASPISSPSNSSTNANPSNMNGMDVPPVPAIPAKYLTSSTPTKKATTSTKKDTKGKDAKEKKAKDVKNVNKEKKANKEKKHPRPPTLAAELALMQFLDGGSLEDNIAHLSHTSSHNSSSTSHTIKGNHKNGCGGEWVYTDAHGRVWRDADEALEYVHLLAPSPTPYSPAFSILSISFPSPAFPSPSTPNIHFPASPASVAYFPSSPLRAGVFPSPRTPTLFGRMQAGVFAGNDKVADKVEGGRWITFTAYSPSSPSFPSPSSSSSPLNAKFSRRRRSSLVKRDSMHKMTMRRRLRQPRTPRTPPCTSLPPTPYSSTPSDIEIDGDVDMEEKREKRMGMAGLGFWAI